MTKRKEYWAFAAALSTAVIFGVSAPIIKLVLVEIPVYIALFLRFTISAFTFLPFLWVADKHTPIRHKDLPRLLLVGTLGATVVLVLAFEGLKRTSSIDAAVILTVLPVIEAFAAWIIFRERFTKTNKIGFAIAFLGGLLIIGEPILEITDGAGEKLFGNFLIFLSVLALVWFTIESKKLLKYYSPIHLVGFMYAVGMITIAPIAFFQYMRGTQWLIHVTLIGFGGVIFLALITSLVANLAWEWALKHSTPGRIGLFLYASPIAAAIVAIPVLGEQLNKTFFIGASVMAIGIFLALRKRHHIIHHYHHGHKI